MTCVLPCVTPALFTDVALPPMVEPLMLASPPLPPFPPLPVPMFAPPLADGADTEPETALPLRASVACGSEVEFDDEPPPPLALLFEFDVELLEPLALPVPPPVVLPLLPLLLPVVPPLLPELGFEVEVEPLVPVLLLVDGEAVEVEDEAPVDCGEPAPVAVELELPMALPPLALAELELLPDAPLPAMFMTVV